MKQAITGYHKDEEDDWVAELECDHFQHVRHKPPFFNRPWVETLEGRNDMIGSELNCIKCDTNEPKDKNEQMIRTAKANDSKSIADIYNYYIDNSIITFETEHVSSEEITQRIAETLAQKLPYLVLEEDNRVVGYAYASKWKGRCAYRFSVESTVYLDHQATGKQYGTKLYEELFEQLKALNYHAVIGGISLPNPASIALHEKMGMEKVAHFKQTGFKFDRWIDVGYWQKLL